MTTSCHGKLGIKQKWADNDLSTQKYVQFLESLVQNDLAFDCDSASL